MYDNPLSFSWLGDFLTNFFAMLRAISVQSGVSLFAVLLAVALLIVAIRGIILKR